MMVFNIFKGIDHYSSEFSEFIHNKLPSGFSGYVRFAILSRQQCPTMQPLVHCYRYMIVQREWTNEGNILRWMILRDLGCSKNKGRTLSYFKITSALSKRSVMIFACVTIFLIISCIVYWKLQWVYVSWTSALHIL